MGCQVLRHLRTETHRVSETLCFLEYRTMDEVQKLSDSDCCTPSCEPFRRHTNILCPVTFYTSHSLSTPREIMVLIQQYKKCYRQNNICIFNEEELRMVVLSYCNVMESSNLIRTNSYLLLCYTVASLDLTNVVMTEVCKT
jgi:hypothetical protein